MKNLQSVLFFLCVWVTSSLLAKQDPWAHLPLHRQADTLRSIILDLGKNDLDSIITLSVRLQNIATKLEDDKKLAFAAEQLGWAYKHKNELGQSIRHYFEAKRLCQGLQSSGCQGTACYNIGLIYARAHEYDKAINYLKQAKGHYQAADKPYKVSLALYDMATSYLNKGEPGSAGRLCEQALDICPKDKLSHLSMIYNQLGWAAKDLGNLAEARRYYRKSLSGLDDSPKWDKKKAIATNNIGETFLLEGRYDSAKSYLQQAVVKKEKLGDHDFTLSTYVLLGELEYGMGHTKKALDLLDQGIAKIKSTNQLSENMGEALALFNTIINDQAHNAMVTGTILKRYLNLQHQQLTAFQNVKNALDKSSWRNEVQIGVNQAEHALETRTLYASMASKTNTYHWILGLAAIVLTAGFVYAGKQKRRKKEAIYDKDTFIAEQIKDYDEQILRMLLMRAGYEEIKDKLNRDFGLDDDDFGR